MGSGPEWTQGPERGEIRTSPQTSSCCLEAASGCWIDGQTDGRTGGWTDGWMEFSPLRSTGHRPLLGLLPCLQLALTLPLIAGQGYRWPLDAFGQLVLSDRAFVTFIMPKKLIWVHNEKYHGKRSLYLSFSTKIIMLLFLISKKKLNKNSAEWPVQGFSRQTGEKETT